MKPVKQKPTRQMPSARTLRVLLEVNQVERLFLQRQYKQLKTIGVSDSEL